MRIRLKTNIGTRDSNITPPLMEGEERDVDKTTGTKLVARGLAEDITPARKTKPKAESVIKAIPDEPAISEAKLPEISPAGDEKRPTMTDAEVLSELTLGVTDAKPTPLKVKSKDKDSK